MILEKENNKGFVALVTAIVLSVILIVVTITLNRSGFFARGAILEAEFKETSSALAEACVDMALLKLATNSPFIFPEAVKVGEEECFIESISSNKIETRASFRESVTNLQVTYDPTDFSIESWEEI